MRTTATALLAITALCVASVPLGAVTIHVPGNDHLTIQAGIHAAAPGDTVVVACGTYYEHDIEMSSGVNLTSETGLSDCVTIDAQLLGRVFYCNQLAEGASIAGFTMTGGLAEDGGGLYCDGSSLRLVDCVVSANQADLRGGGLFATSSGVVLRGCRVSENQTGSYEGQVLADGGGVSCEDSALVSRGCEFAGNECGSDGGGVYCFDSVSTFADCTFEGNQAFGEGFDTRGGGLFCWLSPPILTRCAFSDNRAWDVFAFGGDGGGLYCGNSSGPTLTDCTFSGNRAYQGGAICCAFSSDATLAGCRLSGNGGTVGGGMYCTEGSDATLADCEVSDNFAGIGGGGIACGSTTLTTLSGCMFSANQIGDDGGHGGGAICSSAVISDCAFVGNHAGYAGGLRMEDGEITNCTFTQNGALYSTGGVWCGESTVLTRCIVAFSTSGQAVGGAPTLSCCDLFGNVGGDWVGDIAGQYGLNSNFSADPLFCLEDNPGEPYTLHEGSPCLLENSPCGALVGAFGQGCGPASLVEAASWGAIKSMYR